MLVVEKPLPHYVPPPPSKENLEYADLAIIDLSKATTPEGRAELSRQTSRIFDIANATFDLVSDEEKQEYTQKDVGVYTGYKPRNDWHIASGVRDAIEHYNINRHVVTQTHPQALRPFIPEIAAFASHNHLDVLHPILRHANLSALCFPLLSKIQINGTRPRVTRGYSNKITRVSSPRGIVWFMKYHPREATEEELTKSVWLKGHADIGSITILYSQPIGGLQILSRDNQWRWIKHIDNALVVNAGDAIEFLSGGYYKATRHRVIQPPADQRSIPRLGVFYFSMANDDAKLNPLLESPVLQRIGTTKYFEEGEAPTMEQWRRNRTALYGKSQLKPSEKEVGVEEERFPSRLILFLRVVLSVCMFGVVLLRDRPQVAVTGVRCEGRSELALQIHKALRDGGFFYAINHGYTSAQTARIFDIASATFDLVSDEEKRDYTGKDTSVYRGYKPRKAWVIDPGVRDEIENYAGQVLVAEYLRDDYSLTHSAVHRSVMAQDHPAILRPFLPELAAFTKHNHDNVLQSVLRLLSLSMGLPEDTLTKMHDFDAVVSFIKYHPRGECDAPQGNNVWLKGHTVLDQDIGTVTILYSQPIGGLQILSKDNKWRWIKHIGNAIVINVGDGIEYLSGGYYPATRHRVIQPPVDQRNIPRLGVFYFAMANDDVELSPLAHSPLLRKEGIKTYFKDGVVPTMAEWRRERTSRYRRSELRPSATEEGVEEETIRGTVIKHFN
ncbi:hypothetical protein CCMSSC00406_0008983 [Pleurotus cornucopiae]|uniref:Uncharacterized protein n=1 Tax=Pleurotus cornucopiae TaxID=5321 RepID=A0ACB7JAI0_PLECO|nr:hypothetical protein CCMSSC00406_0008983 [Pleurotus cornucopiae]